MSRSNFASEELKSLIGRIERLNGEMDALKADVSEVYKQAKGTGFDVKIIREVVRLRKMDSAERSERESLIDLYLSALGDLADTPLGQHAIAKVK